MEKGKRQPTEEDPVKLNPAWLAATAAQFNEKKSTSYMYLAITHRISLSRKLFAGFCLISDKIRTKWHRVGEGKKHKDRMKQSSHSWNVNFNVYFLLDFDYGVGLFLFLYLFSFFSFL